jgi:hypothetical protein
MAGRSFIGRSYRTSSPFPMRISRRNLALIAPAAVVAFEIAVVAGAQTKPTVHPRLAPSAPSAGSTIKVGAVTAVPAPSDLKVAAKRRAVSHRATARPAPPVTTSPASTSTATTAIRTAAAPPTTVVSAPPVTTTPPPPAPTVTSAPPPSPTHSSGTKGTGVSSGGDHGGTGTVTGGG